MGRLVLQDRKIEELKQSALRSRRLQEAGLVVQGRRGGPCCSVGGDVVLYTGVAVCILAVPQTAGGEAEGHKSRLPASPKLWGVTLP